MKPVIITADSPVDFSPEQAKRFGIEVIPMHIVLEDREYLDGVDITTPDIFNAYEERGVLVHTSAISISEYADFFSAYTGRGFEVVHLSLSSRLSSTHQNAVLASAQLEGVYVLDTLHLSASIALLAVKGAKLRDEGKSATEIMNVLAELRSRVRTSFVLDTLTFMSKGGRCSSVTAFGANILGIRPSLEMENGELHLAKKYRGKTEAVELQYLEDKLKQYNNIDTEIAVVCHTCLTPEQVELLTQRAQELAGFDEVLQMQAGCTISAHCGPRAMGILFITE